MNSPAPETKANRMAVLDGGLIKPVKKDREQLDPAKRFEERLWRATLWGQVQALRLGEIA